MNAAIFDSHKYAKRLVDAGVTPQAADVHAEMLLEVMSQIAGGSASGERMEARLGAKTDKAVADLNARMDQFAAEFNAKLDRLDAKIDQVGTELRAQIADAKAEMIRMMVGLSVLQLALISALLLKLTR